MAFGAGRRCGIEMAEHQTERPWAPDDQVVQTSGGMKSIAPKRRFTDHKKVGKPLTLSPDHPAVIEGRTMFPSRVTEEHDRLLKSGQNQRKLGSHVSKGRWAGMPIFTLTLEERATCPRSCQHWNDCYGNHMHWPKRHAHGPELEGKLALELAVLAAKYPAGFVVRLHILGDFYSSEYVRRWYRLDTTLVFRFRSIRRAPLRAN
jgi:hypothetical protein